MVEIKTRKFNGKRYRLHITRFKKSEANKYAKRMRQNGRNARVIKFKTKTGKTGYDIYVHTPQRLLNNVWAGRRSR